LKVTHKSSLCQQKASGSNHSSSSLGVSLWVCRTVGFQKDAFPYVCPSQPRCSACSRSLLESSRSRYSHTYGIARSPDIFHPAATICSGVVRTNIGLRKSCEAFIDAKHQQLRSSVLQTSLLAAATPVNTHLGLTFAKPPERFTPQQSASGCRHPVYATKCAFAYIQQLFYPMNIQIFIEDILNNPP